MATPDRHTNREHWLTQAAQLICDFHLADHDAAPTHPFRVTCGFARRQRRDAIATPRADSADQTNEIFISPRIDDAATVLRALTQGLVRAAHDGKKPSKRAEQLAGISDASRAADATTTGSLEHVLKVAAEQLGPYPHASLTAHQGERGSRLLKCSCDDTQCGAVWRASAKQAVRFQICPACASSAGRGITVNYK